MESNRYSIRTRHKEVLSNAYAAVRQAYYELQSLVWTLEEAPDEHDPDMSRTLLQEVVDLEKAQRDLFFRMPKPDQVEAYGDFREKTAVGLASAPGNYVYNAIMEEVHRIGCGKLFLDRVIISSPPDDAVIVLSVDRGSRTNYYSGDFRAIGFALAAIRSGAPVAVVDGQLKKSSGLSRQQSDKS